MITTFAFLMALGVIDGPTTEKVVAPKIEVKDTTTKENTAVDPVAQVSIFVKLLKEKKWRPALSALIVLLIFVWRRFLGKFIINWIPVKHLAWVTAFVGLVAALPAALSIEPFNIYNFILDGLFIGGPAALFWSCIGKHFLKVGNG